MLKRLGMSDYVGADDMERTAMLSNGSAIYLWVFDFEALLGLPTPQVERRISDFLQHTGRLHDQSHDLFVSIKWNAKRPHLDPERLTHLAEHISGRTLLGSSAARLATFQQRPIYLGISTRIRDRVEDHIDPSSDLVSRLRPLKIVDCALLYEEIADPTNSEGIARSPHADDIADFSDPDCYQDMDSYDGDRGISDALSDDLRYLESLLIRTATPLQNIRTDS